MRRARKAANMSRTDLSAKVGKSVAVIRMIERGHVRVTERYLARVFEACGLDPETFEPGPGAICVSPYDTVRPSSRKMKID